MPPAGPSRRPGNWSAPSLGTVATFMVLFGLGMRSWAIVALGVALLALAIALATIRGGGRAWVVGDGDRAQASEPPAAYAHGRCELEIVVDAPGLPPRSRRMIEPRVPIAKWPVAGQLLPVQVALDDHRRIRILWDEVPTHAEAPLAGAVDGTPAAGTDTLVAEFGAPLDELLIEEKPRALARPPGGRRLRATRRTRATGHRRPDRRRRPGRRRSDRRW